MRCYYYRAWHVCHLFTAGKMETQYIKWRRTEVCNTKTPEAELYCVVFLGMYPWLRLHEVVSSLSCSCNIIHVKAVPAARPTPHIITSCRFHSYEPLEDVTVADWRSHSLENSADSWFSQHSSCLWLAIILAVSFLNYIRGFRTPDMICVCCNDVFLNIGWRYYYTG
jgi:hypothetical protein